MNTTYTTYSQIRYRLDSLTEHCLLGIAFFLPISLDISSFFLVFGAFFWMGKMLSEQKILWKKTPLDKAIAIYILLSGASIAASPDKWFSFYNYYNLMGKYILIYYLVINNINSLKQLKFLLRGLFVSAALVIVYGFYQYFQGIDISALNWVDGNQFPELKTRVFSTLGNPNLLAGFLVMIMALFFGLSIYEQQFHIKLRLYSLVAIAGICLMLTYSRGLWLSLLAVWIIYGKFYNKKVFWLLIPFLFLIIFEGGGFAERLLSIVTPVDSSSALRLALWESTRFMIMDHPLWGVGWGSYWLVYPQYDFFINNPSVVICHAHNMYLNIAAEIGLPGLLAFLAILFGHIRIAFHIFTKTEGSWQSGLMLGILAALVGLSISGLTDYIMFNTQISMLFWFLNAVVIVVWQLRKKNNLKFN